MTWYEFLGVIAAVITIAIAISSVIVKYFLKKYRPKPRGEPVTDNFTYFDVKFGMEYLVEWARGHAPTAIIGINRGGSIVEE